MGEIKIKEIEKQVEVLERSSGRWVMSYAVDEGGKITDVEYANFGPLDDYVINVRGFKPSLCRQINCMKLESVDDKIPDDLKSVYEEWLVDNVEAQGGAINISGIYRVVLGMPIAIADALGITPEMEIWDEDDDDDF